MNPNSNVASTRALTKLPSRRHVLRGLTGVGLTRSPSWLTHVVEAKKKRKRKHKGKHRGMKPKRNAYGCLNVGQPCNGDSSQCCSGRCEGAKPKKGKKDTSVCVGHDSASICFPDTDTCCLGTQVRCDPVNPLCVCALTTGNAGFCGDFTVGVAPLCQACSRDVDCQEALGEGAACVVLAGVCRARCPETGYTACVPACNATAN